MLSFHNLEKRQIVGNLNKLILIFFPNKKYIAMFKKFNKKIINKEKKYQ